MSVTHESEFTEEQKGNVLTPEQMQGDNDGLLTIPAEFSPEFLAELAKLAPEDKEAAEKAEADRLAAEKAEAEKVATEKAAEEKAAAEKEAEAKELEKKGFIPQGRFNEINNEKKAAEEKIAEKDAENKRLLEELEAFKKGEVNTKEPDPDPLELMENKIVELDLVKQAALSDYGFDSEEYRGAVKDYNRAQRDLMRMEAATEAGNAVAGLKGENAAQAKIREQMDEVGEAAYEVYPFLNINGDNADETAINDVVKYRNALISAGMAAPKALQEAIDTFGPLHLARIGVKPPTDGETEVQKTVRESREKAAREKAEAAIKNQPSFVKGKTDDGGLKIDINKMTPAEIAKLPKELLDKLNGNELSEEDKRRAA